MPVTICISRELPLPVDAAYAWLTDYREDDPTRANGVLIAKRKILARGEHKVLMEGEHRAFGRVIPSVYEVTLAPPDAWTSRVVEGPRKGSVTRYRLSRLPSDRARLDVEYRMQHEDLAGRIILRVAKAKVRRDLENMWDGYEAAMRADAVGEGSGEPRVGVPQVGG